MIDHSRQISQDIGGGYAQHRNALRRQPMGSGRIVAQGIRPVMAAAVHFDGQSNDRAVEIQDIDAGWMLATEFEAVRALAQRLPQQPFRQGHLAAQFTRALHRSAWSGQHGTCPSTVLRTVPLPVPGRNAL